MKLWINQSFKYATSTVRLRVKYWYERKENTFVTVWLWIRCLKYTKTDYIFLKISMIKLSQHPRRFRFYLMIKEFFWRVKMYWNVIWKSLRFVKSFFYQLNERYQFGHMTWQADIRSHWRPPWGFISFDPMAASSRIDRGTELLIGAPKARILRSNCAECTL